MQTASSGPGATSDHDDETEEHIQAELQPEACREEQLLDTCREESELDLTTARMKKELQAMKDFGMYDEVSVNDLGENYNRGALPTMWIKRPKGTDVRCRLVCKSCYQEKLDKGDTYASAPLLITLNLLLFVGLVMDYGLNLNDISMLFLHADFGGGLRTTPGRVLPERRSVVETTKAHRLAKDRALGIATTLRRGYG